MNHAGIMEGDGGRWEEEGREEGGREEGGREEGGEEGGWEGGRWGGDGEERFSHEFRMNHGAFFINRV